MADRRLVREITLAIVVKRVLTSVPRWTFVHGQPDRMKLRRRSHFQRFSLTAIKYLLI